MELIVHSGEKRYFFRMNVKNTSRKGKDYELFVQDIMESLHKPYFMTINIESPKVLTGLSGQKHQIDIYWEYRLAGVTYKVAIDCKNYNSDVKKEKVAALIGIINDVPGIQGLLVTSKGFQKGAIKMAKAHKIGLKIIRPPIEEDFSGRIQEIKFSFQRKSPYNVTAQVEVDEGWAKLNLSTEQVAKVRKVFSSHPKEVLIMDIQLGKQFTIEDLVNKFPISEQEVEVPVSTEYKWDNAFFKLPNGPEVKIWSIKFSYQVNCSPCEFSLNADTADAIVRDAITGSLLFVDQEKITGDTEQEFSMPIFV